MSVTGARAEYFYGNLLYFYFFLNFFVFYCPYLTFIIIYFSIELHDTLWKILPKIYDTDEADNLLR